MSNDRFSLGEFKEFLNNDDDSDGHLLAEFLQKKKGNVRRRRVFNDESARFSLSVRLEKVPPSPAKGVQEHDDEPQEQEQEHEPPKEPTVSRVIDKVIEPPPAISPPPPPAPQCDPISPSANLMASPSARLSLRKSGGISSADRLRRYSLKRLSTLSCGRRTLLKEFESTLNSQDFLPPICSTPVNQSPTTSEDANANEEVEKTLVSSNKSASSSTPSEGMMHDLQRKDDELRELLKSVVETTLKEVHEQNCIQNRSLCAKTPTPSPPSPQKSPASARCRSYTIAKGATQGQLILTPTRSPPPPEIVNLISPSTSANSSQNRQGIMASPRQASILKRLYATEQSRSQSPQQAKHSRTLPRQLIVDTSSVKREIAEEAEAATKNDTDIEIPETQELPVETKKLLKSMQNSKIPMIVIPVHQTFNGGAAGKQTHSHVHDETPITSASPKKPVNDGKTTSSPELTTKTISRAVRTEVPPIISKTPTPAEMPAVTEDQLRLNDILTDDEDDYVQPNLASQQRQATYDTTQKRRVINDTSSSAPLDLASSVKSTRVGRRQRKRSTTRRRLELEQSQLMTTETETEMGPPRAHVLNLRRRRSQGRDRTQRHSRKTTLNKAPNTPINGEKFAVELKAQLARLTNYEIVDLRKRNSIGKVFTISGRKSVSKQEAFEQRIQLEEEIQTEILKRTLQGNSEGLDQVTESETGTEDEVDANQLPSAPDAFKDNNMEEKQPLHEGVPVDDDIQLALAQLTVAGTYNSSLIDDRSCDRISFVRPSRRTSNNSSKHSKRSRCKAPVPELVQGYLNVTKEIGKHKRVDQTKRLLYSKGNSDIEPSPEPVGKVQSRRTTRSKQSAEEVVPPPPLFTTTGTEELPIASPPSPHLSLRIVSPPPPTSARRRTLRIASPPPPITPSPPHRTYHPIVSAPPPLDEQTPRHSVQRIVSPGRTFRKSFPSPLQLRPLPPPESFSNDASKTDTSRAETSRSKSSATTIASSVDTAAENATLSDKDLFKMPQKPAPKKRGRKRNLKVTTSVDNHEEETSTAEQGNDSESQSLRRSKRGHIPLKNSWSFRTTDPTPLFQIMYNEQFLKSLKLAEKAKAKTKAKTTRARTSSRVTSTDCEQLSMASGTSNSYASDGSATKNAQPPYSMLGDTNATSYSTTSVQSNRNLPTIFEPAEEQDVEMPAAQEVASSSKTKSKTLEKRAPQTEQPKKTESRKRPAQPTRKTKKATNGLECSHIALNPTPVDQLNTMFDQLKSASMCQTEPIENNVHLPQNSPTRSIASTASAQTKGVRVRVRRLSAASSSKSESPRREKKNKNKSRNVATPPQSPRRCEQPTEQDNAAQTSSSHINSDLLSWLKGITDTQLTAENTKIFQEMHCSAGGNLMFTDLEGIDYAFYDTDEKASLGYLRFKPRQTKPAKRAKKYHLHFVVLSGEFKIGTNLEVGTFTLGDMVAINKGCRYTIENITDDIGLVMVIKK